jgi:hypothetical protein
MNDIRQYYIPEIFHMRPNVISKFYNLFAKMKEFFFKLVQIHIIG